MRRCILFIFTALIALSTFSCGPSAEEKAKVEQAKADSIKAATEDAMKQKFAVKEALQSKLQNATSYLEKLNEQLVNTKASLDVANSDMDKIKEFHVMRTNSEREEQVRAQSIKIQSIQSNISNIEQTISNQQASIAQIKADLEQYK